jgi:hypothetical protein
VVGVLADARVAAGKGTEGEPGGSIGVYVPTGSAGGVGSVGVGADGALGGSIGVYVPTGSAGGVGSVGGVPGADNGTVGAGGAG